MTDTATLYSNYKNQMQQIADIKYANAVLQWDQETYLPPKGAAGRARQMATLSQVAHQMFTNTDLGNVLQQLLLRKELTPKQLKNVHLSWEDYEKQLKFTSEFVRQMSEAVSASFYAWVEARKQNNFKIFEPALEKLVELKKQEANIIGFTSHPYNALLNEYEKGATVEMLDKVFEDITQPLKDLLLQVQQQPLANNDFLHQQYHKDKQWSWGMYLIKELGFDFEAGRQDMSEHPFTTNFSAKDVRLTTRIDENDFANMTWSCIHEAGHGLYEQGLPDEEYGLPLGEYASLSIHESQSRLWENCIGRSLPFWKQYLPKLQEFFPEQLQNITPEAFCQAINKVQPSFIRTEADELTYHFHVMIRYELEKKLIAGQLNVADIPLYWNEAYQKYLGITVPNDKVGCLQDVHWSHGSFGYFATYSLGSFYAAQFWLQAKKEIIGVEQQIENGETAVLLAWLREKIHQHGRMYTSEELCERITGEKLNSKYFIQYLQQKLNTK